MGEKMLGPSSLLICFGGSGHGLASSFLLVELTVLPGSGEVSAIFLSMNGYSKGIYCNSLGCTIPLLTSVSNEPISFVVTVITQMIYGVGAFNFCGDLSQMFWEPTFQSVHITFNKN